VFSVEQSSNTNVNSFIGTLLVIINVAIIVTLLWLVLRELWRLPSVLRARVWVGRHLARVGRSARRRRRAAPGSGLVTQAADARVAPVGVAGGAVQASA
jgi:hypothetical protein